MPWESFLLFGPKYRNLEIKCSHFTTAICQFIIHSYHYCVKTQILYKKQMQNIYIKHIHIYHIAFTVSSLTSAVYM